MCFRYFKKKKSERKVVKSINKMNRKLNTSFSYVYCLEEMDLLKSIPETDVQDKLRLEHISNVLSLWLKGITDESNYKSKSKKDEDYIFSYFKVFRKKLFDLFIKNKVLSEGKLPECNVDKTYFTEIEKYEYINEKDRLEKIDFAHIVLETLEKKLKPFSIKKVDDPKVIHLFKTEYYGPMSLYNAYPKMIKKDEKNIFKGKLLPFEFGKKNHLLKSLRALDDKKNSSKYDIVSFFSKELKIETLRLEFEENRINEKHDNYDFYFDTFLWRLLNDLEYLYSKKLGGIRKIVDLVKLNSKSKQVKIGAKEREAIVVDVDSMEATTNEYLETKNKKSSGGGKKLGLVDVHELDAKEKRENVRRDEIVREMQAHERRR